MDSTGVAAAAGINVGSDVGRQLDCNSASHGFKGTVALRLSNELCPDGAARGLGLHRIAGLDFNASACGVGFDFTRDLGNADASSRGAGVQVAIDIAAVNMASGRMQLHIAVGAGEINMTAGGLGIDGAADLSHADVSARGLGVDFAVDIADFHVATLGRNIEIELFGNGNREIHLPQVLGIRKTAMIAAQGTPVLVVASFIGGLPSRLEFRLIVDRIALLRAYDLEIVEDLLRLRFPYWGENCPLR